MVLQILVCRSQFDVIPCQVNSDLGSTSCEQVGVCNTDAAVTDGGNGYLPDVKNVKEEESCLNFRPCKGDGRCGRCECVREEEVLSS